MKRMYIQWETPIIEMIRIGAEDILTASQPIDAEKSTDEATAEQERSWNLPKIGGKN